MLGLRKTQCRAGENPASLPTKRRKLTTYVEGFFNLFPLRTNLWGECVYISMH